MTKHKKIPTDLIDDINVILIRLELDDAFDETILKHVLARKLPRGENAEEFIFSKLDDLKAHVSTHHKTGDTDGELKTLITDWLTTESALADICAKYPACDNMCKSCKDEAAGRVR